MLQRRQRQGEMQAVWTLSASLTVLTVVPDHAV